MNAHPPEKLVFYLPDICLRHRSAFHPEGGTASSEISSGQRCLASMMGWALETSSSRLRQQLMTEHISELGYIVVLEMCLAICSLGECSIASQRLLSRPKPTGFFAIANPMCSSLFAAFVDHIQILGFSTVQQVKCNSLD